MPYRDRAQVQRWLTEFWDSHTLFDGELTVVDSDFVPHNNSGLVVAHLRRSPGTAFLSVHIVDDQPRWLVTFEARTEPLDLDATAVHDLASEISALGVLCAYLQARTDEALPRQ